LIAFVAALKQPTTQQYGHTAAAGGGSVQLAGLYVAVAAMLLPGVLHSGASVAVAVGVLLLSSFALLSVHCVDQSLSNNRAVISRNQAAAPAAL
jgi:hypothetical protein